MKERLLKLSGGELAYLHREGEGPSLIFLHGAGNRAGHLSALAEALPERAVVIPEARGRGRSAGLPAGSMEERAAEMIELISALGLEDVVLLGHSLGGGLALEMALKKPAQLRALVLMCTGARLRVRPEIFESVRAGALPFDPYSPALGVDERARLAALEESVPPEAALLDWASADGFDRMVEVESISLPTLIIAGEDDVMTPPKYARYLASTMPNAELAVVAEGGHMLPMERPAEAAERIDRFLKSCELSGEP